MFDIDRWSEIWASVSSNKLRTSLSGFTIALALFVFITLFGLGNGLQNGFQEQFFKQNSLNITISGGTTSETHLGYKKGRKIALKNKDLDFIQKSFPNEIKHAIATIAKSVLVRNNTNSGTYSVTAVFPSYIEMTTDNVKMGRYISDEDVNGRKKSIVIGRLVAQDFFPNQVAVGQFLNIGESMYQVVGVFENTDGGDNAERAIYVPFSTFETIYATDEVSSIIITPDDRLSLKEISQLANTIEYNLKQRYYIAPNDYSGLRVRNAAEMMEETDSFFVVLSIIVFVIGGGSLIAGVVSIGNIMVFSVKQRTKEIGIRKALGATPMNVLLLIMQEAVVITLVFGAIGIILASLLIENINDGLEEYFIYNPGVSLNSIIIATVILFISGFISGLIPALNAARIKPIDALRDE